MPELPEVETVVRDLRPQLCGRTIVGVRLGRKRLRKTRSETAIREIVGRRLLTLGRRGKYILAEMESLHLVIHLGMTGQLTIGPSDRKPESHTHFTAAIDDGSELRFRDVRRFGSITVFPDDASLRRYLDARLGPEPFDIDAEALHRALSMTSRSLKAALLDQRLMAGIGNIYADESLFVAKLAPTRRGCSMTLAESRILRRAVVSILNRAIERRGSTIRDFIGGAGASGSYQGEFQVYGKTNEPCRNCRSPIQRIRLAGRSTHFCPTCQPASRRRSNVYATAGRGT